MGSTPPPCPLPSTVNMLLTKEVRKTNSVSKCHTMLLLHKSLGAHANFMCQNTNTIIDHEILTVQNVHHILITSPLPLASRHGDLHSTHPCSTEGVSGKLHLQCEQALQHHFQTILSVTSLLSILRNWSCMQAVRVTNVSSQKHATI